MLDVVESKWAAAWAIEGADTAYIIKSLDRIVELNAG